MRSSSHSSSSRSHRSSRSSRHDATPTTDAVAAAASSPVTPADAFAADGALSHRISIAETQHSSHRREEAGRSSSSRSLDDIEEASRSSGSSRSSSTKHKRSDRSSSGRSRDKGSGQLSSKRRAEATSESTAVSRVRVILTSVRGLCDCSSRSSSENFDREKSDRDTRSSSKRGLRRFLRWRLAIGAGMLWVVVMWLTLVYCPDASAESEFELDTTSHLCVIGAPIRALAAIFASLFSATAAQRSERDPAAVTALPQLVSKRLNHRAERLQLNATASSFGRSVADEQPLIPGTTPFTILSLLRDMPSESELQSLQSSMASRAYQDQLFQYALQWNALVSWTQIVKARHIIVFMDTEESCRKLVAREGFEELQCFVVPCWHPTFHKPLLDCIFHAAHTASRTDLMAYITGDVIVHPSLPETIHAMVQATQRGQMEADFLLVARRSDVDLTSSMIEHYARGLENLAAIRAHAETYAQPHSGFGIDMFVYRRALMRLLHFEPAQRERSEAAQLYPREYNLAARAPAAAGEAEAAAYGDTAALHFPPLLAGVYRWDNWLLSELILHPHVSVVDVSAPNLVLHQLIKGRRRLPHPQRRGAEWNDALVKRLSGKAYRLGSIDHANLVLQGSCPDCTLAPHETVEVLLRQRSTVGGASAAQGLQAFGPSDDAGTARLDGIAGRPLGAWVALISVSSRQEAWLENWSCWAARTNFSHYVFLAADQKIAALLRTHAAPFVLADGAPLESVYPGESLSFVSWRTKFAKLALKNGFAVLLSSVHSLWMQGGLQPFHYFTYGPDEAHRSKEVWVRGNVGLGLGGAVAESQQVSSRLLVMKATKYAQYFLAQIDVCLDAILVSERAAAMKSESAANPNAALSATHHLDSCVSEKFKSLKAKLASGWLDPDRFPTARRFFREREPQARGVQPLILELSDFPEAAAWDAMSHWGLVATPVNPGLSFHEASAPKPIMEEEAADAKHGRAPHLHCLPIPEPPHHAPPPLTLSGVTQPFTFTIRILTFNRLAHLQRLVASLLAANYGSDTVELVVSVDRPAGDIEALRKANDTLVAEWDAVCAACLALRWPHGDFRCLLQPAHLGLLGQWVSFASKGDRDLTLVLEDDTAVSPDWYAWTRAAVMRYYLAPAAGEYDPRLFGISLQLQHTILGETSSRSAQAGSYSSARTPFDLLPQSSSAGPGSHSRPGSGSGSRGNRTHLYKYQLLGTWGSLIFPSHWTEFRGWLDAQGFDAATGHSTIESSIPGGLTPCVPNLLSNDWWARRSTSVWSAWFIRFVFERGYYSLYTNFARRRSLVVNHRAPGLNFKEERGASNELWTRATASADEAGVIESFPPLSSIPTYDFWFRRVSTPPSTLALAAGLHPPPPLGLSRCWTQADFRALSRSRAASMDLARQYFLAEQEARLYQEVGHVSTKEHLHAMHEGVVALATPQAKRARKKSAVATQWEKMHPNAPLPVLSKKQQEAFMRYEQGKILIKN